MTWPIPPEGEAAVVYVREIHTGPRFKTSKGDSRSSEEETRSRGTQRQSCAGSPASPGMQSAPSLSCHSQAKAGKLQEAPLFLLRPQSAVRVPLSHGKPNGEAFP